MISSWQIAKKELASFFDSLVAYVVLVLFLAFTGFFTWLWGGGDIFFRKQADLLVFFNVAYWTLFFFIPAVTMRMIAEEKRSGTIELLLTKDISIREIIFGKFLACLFMVIIALLFTLPYYFTVASLGDMDHGATLTGYLGLIFMSAVYIAIGIWTSSITNNQIIAFLIAIAIGIVFHMLLGMLASSQTGGIGELLETLSLQTHYDSISRGVIDSKDIIYFLSMVVLGLGAAELSIAKR